MDIRSGQRGNAQLWHHAEAALVALGIWTERIPGRGEDADPLVLFHRPSRRGLISVSDGVGGAGRAAAGRAEDGTTRTQAWVAARRVRALVEEWFAVDPERDLTNHLATRLAVSDLPRSRVRGTIHREFPTTLATLDFHVENDRVRWDIHWAGDSRCYVAEADVGLQQLSSDDTDQTDALELLTQDPPMTNMVCANREFRLNHWRGAAPLPCILLCATDGFFGYVDTPAEFEHLLWSTLLSAQDTLHWSALLAEQVSAFTGDDASLALVALGFTGFDDLRVYFRRRAESVRTEHAEPMSRARSTDQTTVRLARERSWRRYRADYERRLPATGANR